MRKKKGGAAGDPWMGDRIAGQVTTMPSGTFESDKGIISTSRDTIITIDEEDPASIVTTLEKSYN